VRARDVISSLQRGRTVTRRETIVGAAALLGAGAANPLALAAASVDLRLRIAPLDLELAPGVIVKTIAYNEQVPGPAIRARRGRRMLFEVENATSIDELVHWHGLQIPSDVDGAAEEGTAPVPPGGTRRYAFTPGPIGTHWYHTHAMGGADLSIGAYTAQFGFFIVDDPADPGDYDREVLLAMHHWEPRWVSGRTMRPEQAEHGFELAYAYGSFNGRLLGHADPVRVRAGERVLFRILNASATEMTWTALAGHRLTVISMDGYRIPQPRTIDVLMLGPGERADVLVHMTRPGKWILGAANAAERAAGMGVVVEYQGSGGAPVWLPVERRWNYLDFARPTPAAEPDERIELAIGRVPGGAHGHNRWMLNNRQWPDTQRIHVRRGRRYRLVLKNQTDHGHPMHLHRHHFEVASYAGVSASGLMKDTINVQPFTTVELDFVANNPGPTLIHCHQAKHADMGMMALMLYEGDIAPAVDHAHMHR
jgi:FtsP/CotA-like multicopper oxidase with cupredoxin domain